MHTWFPVVYAVLRACNIAPASRRRTNWQAAIHNAKSISFICVRLELLQLIASNTLAAVGWVMGNTRTWGLTHQGQRSCIQALCHEQYCEQTMSRLACTLCRLFKHHQGTRVAALLFYLNFATIASTSIQHNF